ncbi:hypothetical protein Tco_1393185 [Tanacetum coccineum]
MSWEAFKILTREEFCLSNEMQKLETELWNHAMVWAGHAAYTNRFHELARLVPHLVTPESKRIKREANKRDSMVVRDFLEVFPDDLSRLPPVREIKFRIELVPRAMLVPKSPYRLAPFELEELLGQLREL